MGIKHVDIDLNIEESWYADNATQAEREAAMRRMQGANAPEFDKYFEDEEDGDES